MAVARTTTKMVSRQMIRKGSHVFRKPPTLYTGEREGEKWE